MANNQTLSGCVVPGKQLGRKLGFPTANVVVDDINNINVGIWIVKVDICDVVYYGVANIGYRPTVDNDRRLILEVYIFDLCEDLYGKFIKVEFLEYVRAEQKFDSVELLKESIEKDIAFARREIVKYKQG